MKVPTTAVTTVPGIPPMAARSNRPAEPVVPSECSASLATHPTTATLNTSTPFARITGLVTIAGVQHPVAATATVRADTLGALHVLGSYVIHPTEFGVAPPRRLGGLLRVHDDVTVHFEVVLDPDARSIDVSACRLLDVLDANDGTHASCS